jgi:hypothetical protein
MAEQITKPAKVYVDVIAAFDKIGNVKPLQLVWEDGQKYKIDHILDVRQAAAMKAGGQGERYTIRVKGKESYLFFEQHTGSGGNTIGKWFVERR